MCADVCTRRCYVRVRPSQARVHAAARLQVFNKLVAVTLPRDHWLPGAVAGGVWF